MARLKVCSAAVYNSPEYVLLRPHIPFILTDASLQQLSDQSTASADEISAILLVHPMTQECRRAYLNELSQSEPSLVPIVTGEYVKREDVLLTLIRRRISWGEYIREARDRAVKTQGELVAENRRVVAGLERENEAEIAQRQRAAAALAAWAQTQEIINAANRPVITNCSGFGSMINCVSQ